eukprot:scaffold25435_cov17-Tisochrysis_lutea.AAC.1
MKEKGHFLAHPDALISAVGTKVHSFDGESWREDAAWTAQLDKDWDLVAVRDAAYKALTQVGYAAFSHPLLWIIHVCGTAQPTKRVDGACVHRQRRLGELQQMRRKGESLWEGKAWQEVYSWCRLVQIWALCSHGVDGEDAHAWAPGSSLAGEAAGCEQQTHGYSCQQLAPKACWKQLSAAFLFKSILLLCCPPFAHHSRTHVPLHQNAWSAGWQGQHALPP